VNVLIVEPDGLLGSIYQKVLESAGHRVVWSTGAQGAITLADVTTPDVVVLELQLRGHSGIEFLYEFRSYPEWQAIPIILHTFVPRQALTLPAQLNVPLHLYKPTTKLTSLVHAVSEAASVKT